MSFLLFVIFFIFLVVAIVFSIGASLLRALFGGGNKTKNTSNNRQQYHDRSGHSSGQHSAHKKVFRKDEGEYVDFEEIE